MNELKKRQRRAGIAAREDLSPEQRRDYSARIAANITGLEVFRRARVVFLYRAIRAEVDLRTVTEAALATGKAVLYPYCGDGEMRALRPPAKGGWTRDAYGILSPAPDKSELCAPGDIDLVICPCTAFDAEGGRCGMGGGNYDRFLPLCTKAVILAAAFEAQKADKLFTEAFDVRMDGVVTESQTYNIRKSPL